MDHRPLVPTSGFFVAENEAHGQAWLALDRCARAPMSCPDGCCVCPAYGLRARDCGVSCNQRERHPWRPLRAHGRRRVALVRLRQRPSAARPLQPAPGVCGVRSVRRGNRARPAAGEAPAAALLVSPYCSTSPRSTARRRWCSRRSATRPTAPPHGGHDQLAAHYDGGVIMMSMGSLAHYMHDLSSHGFGVRSFLHEGNGDLWVVALQQGPHGFAAGWSWRAGGKAATRSRSAAGPIRSSIAGSNGWRRGEEWRCTGSEGKEDHELHDEPHFRL